MQKPSSSYLILSFALGFVSMLCVALKIETVHLLEGWHWQFHTQELAPLAIVIFGAVFCAANVWLYSQKRSFGQACALLFMLALGSQWSFSWSNGSGTTQMRHHAIASGHSEFVITASRGFNGSEVLERYEDFVLLPTQQFSPSKPPGQLLAYIAMDKLSRMIMPEAPHFEEPIAQVLDPPHRQLIELLTILLPIVAAFTVVPFFALCRQLRLNRPWVPPILFLVSAPFSLIVMHFDQALYPLLSCSMWWCVAKGVERPNMFWAALAGTIAGVGIFISFSLLPAIILCIPVALAAPKPQTVQWMRSIVLFLLGGSVFYLYLWADYGYNPIERYQNAMLHHAAWKGWVNEGWLLWLSIKLNVIELLWWISPPAGLLLLHSWLSRKATTNSIPFGILFTLVLLLFLGKTIGEVARLWLFLMPLLWIQVHIHIEDLPPRTRHKTQGFLLVFMFFWTTIFKWQQDFW